MKKLPIAAAALLLGTSAYAMVPSGDPTDGTMQTDPYTVEPTAAVAPAADEAPALQPAAVDTWTTAQPVAYTAEPTDPELKTVTATSDEVKAAELAKAEAKVAADDDAEWAAAAEAKLANAAADDTVQLQPASVETGFTTDDSAADKAADDADMSATTGADETVVAAADLTPRPAAQNYPACRPGRGDDNCIQLYERGVQARLASWTQPTGGFAGDAGTRMAAADEAVDDSAIETAQADEAGTEAGMGGPYEPVADDAGMNGDGSVDTALGETADDEEVVGV